MILCVRNNKRYYGETSNLSARISRHKSLLNHNKHEVSELQHHWNSYGADSFEFSIVYVNRNSSKEERQAIENELIHRWYGLCYNKFDKPNRKKENNPFAGKTHSDETRSQISASLKETRQNSPLPGTPILLNGVRYSSITEASRETTHSRDTIRRWLNDPDNQNCVFIDIENSSNTHLNSNNLLSETDPLSINAGIAKPVSIDGVVYTSIGAAAKKLNCSRALISKRLRSDKNCFLIDNC
jgi:group I intron endonuclease